MFRPNCKVIFRLIFEQVQCTIDNALSIVHSTCFTLYFSNTAPCVFAGTSSRLPFLHLLFMHQRARINAIPSHLEFPQVPLPYSSPRRISDVNYGREMSAYMLSCGPRERDSMAFHAPEISDSNCDQGQTRSFSVCVRYDEH